MIYLREHVIGGFDEEKYTSHIGFGSLRDYLVSELHRKFEEAVPATMVLLEQRLSEVTADLVRIESKIHEISDVARLRGSALLRADSICNHLQALLKGVADPSPEQWGKTTELERLESGIGGWPGVTADVKPPNATFRLYGGAAFDRVVLEFRCAVYSMECPVVSREKVANILLAHNGQGGRDGTTETAAEISRAIARTWFSPILDITCDRLAFVLCNLFDIAMERNRQHYSGGQRLEYKDHYVGFDARLRHSYNCFIKDLAKQCKEVIGIFLDSATSPYSQYCYENDVTPSFILVPRINQVPSELHCLEPSDGTPKLRKDIINGQETIPREKSATTRGKVAKSREAIREGQMTVPETPSPDQPRVGKYGVEKERGNSLKDKARKKRKATGNNKFMGSFSSQNDGSHSFETARESGSVYSAICSDVAQHFTRIRAALVETGVETNLKSRFLIPWPHGDPQMMRFGAHLVLVLRYLLADQMKDNFREKILTVGDYIIHMYAMFLFTKHHEELVGIYASQLAGHRCIDLFVHMMELRLDSSVHIRYKVFLSAIEYLPFSPEDDSKGSFEEIIDRVLSRSRESVGKHDKSSDVAEHHREQSLQKAMVIQWLCFTPPTTINDAKSVTGKLVLRALMHSNLLFREFALISMWRVPAMPIGAHTVLSLLAEPLKQPTEILLSTEDHGVSENLREFQDWSEYYSCDAKYRTWLKIELENADVSESELSVVEKQRAVTAAKEALISSLSLLERKDNPWLVPTQDHLHESTEPVYLELHATAMLCLPSGECMSPDATLCTTLTSALYASVTEEEILHRNLMVNVSVSLRDNYCIEVVLRCLAVEGDGLGPYDLNDGGILASVMAAGFKGELARFQAGVTMEISRLDAWYSSADGSLDDHATYIVRGLCRKCCIPEIFLRCLQVSVSLMESGYPPERHHELIELVTSPEIDFLHSFSQHQLQELLLFERDYRLFEMDLEVVPDT